MKAILALAIIVSLMAAAPAWAQATSPRPGTIEVTRAFFSGAYPFGVCLKYQDRTVTKANDLREVFKTVQDPERDQLLEQSEGHTIISNVLSIPGAALAGIGVGQRSGPLMAVGFGLWAVGIGFGASAEQAKVQAVTRFNSSVSAVGPSSLRLLPPDRPGQWFRLGVTF